MMNGSLNDVLSAARMNRRMLSRALEGVPDSVATRRPPEGGNHIVFLALHLLDTRAYASGLIHDAPLEHAFSEMLASATRLDDIPSFPPLDEVAAAWEEVSDTFEGRVESLDEASASRDLGRRYPNGRSDLLGVLSFLTHHETYHIGQVNLLRRIGGLTPVSFQDREGP